MTEKPMGERRFTDAEVHAILEKAVEGGPGQSIQGRDGLSLAELKSIGAEVGIDPHRLEDAARAVVGQKASASNPIVGTATVLHATRTVDGDFESLRTADLLSVIRRGMGRHGVSSGTADSLEWSASGESGERFVTVAATSDGVQVQGTANLTNLALATMLPVGIVTVIITLIGFTQVAESGSLLGAAFFAALVPSVFVALRAILKRATAAEQAKLDVVVDEVARLIADSRDRSDEAT